MGQITQVEEIALVLLLLVGAILGQWKTGQIVAQVDRLPARNRDGSLPRLAATEQFSLASYLPHQRSKQLRHLILEGILLAGLTLLMLGATGMIPGQ